MNVLPASKPKPAIFSGAILFPIFLHSCLCIHSRARTLHGHVFNARYQTAPCSPVRTNAPTTSCSAAGSTCTASTATSSRDTAAAVTLAAALPVGVARLRIPEVQRGRQELQLHREVRGQRGAAHHRQARLSPPAYSPDRRAAVELRHREPELLEPQRQASDCPGEFRQGQPGLLGDPVKVEHSPEQRRHYLQHWGDRKRPLQIQQALIEDQEPLVQLLRQNLATNDEDTSGLTPGKKEAHVYFRFQNHFSFIHLRSHIKVLVHNRGGDGTGDDAESFRAIATGHHYPRTSSYEDSGSSSIQRVSPLRKMDKIMTVMFQLNI